MKCRCCGEEIKGKAFAVAGPYAWCDRECWAEEGERVKADQKAGKPVAWNPRTVQFNRPVKP